MPLGPSGMCIVSTFALKGTAAGRSALCGLLLAEVIFMSVALMLRYFDILALSASLQFFFTMVFSLFLVVFGFTTFKNRRANETAFPSKFINIFSLSMLNPTILIFYLGLLIMAEKRMGPNISLWQILSLVLAFLVGIVGTLLFLGEAAQKRKDFIHSNMRNILGFMGPAFIIVGIVTAIFSMK